MLHIEKWKDFLRAELWVYFMKYGIIGLEKVYAICLCPVHIPKWKPNVEMWVIERVFFVVETQKHPSEALVEY
jgi:hypothetical protein